MEKLLVVIVLAWMGLIFGSFAGAQVWRLRARQLVEDQADGERVDTKELKRLKHLNRPVSQDHSECLYCHHQLAWYDLVPLMSWLSTGGRCRYCHTRIGWFEPLMELGVAIVFVSSYLWWPVALINTLEIARFALWLVAVVVMAVLFAYDAKWSLLPYRLNLSLIGVGLVAIIVTYVGQGSISFAQFLSLIGALLLLGGLYLTLSLFGLVGAGDGILGFGLAMLLMDWKLAFLTVFLANFLGCLMLIPLAIQRKLHRGARIPFGPFLIIAASISLLWGNLLIQKAFELPLALY